MATITYDPYDMSNNNFPPNPPQNDPPKPTPPRETHRRGYQACDPCRERKVKCDLGSVDEPHDPPCARCRRESKNCVFSSTRKKRKASHGNGEESSEGEIIPRLAKKRTNKNDRFGSPNTPDLNLSYSSQPHTPHAHNQWPQDRQLNPQVQGGLPQMHPAYQQQTNSPLAPPANSKPRPAQMQPQHQVPMQQQPQAPNRTGPQAKNPNTNEHVLNKEAATMLEPAIYTSHDGLKLLSNASEQVQKVGAPSHTRSTSGGSQINGPSHRRNPSSFDALEQPDSQGHEENMEAQEDLQAALRMWSRMRLVKDGCLNAQEAMAYVDYYYEHLSPMTPVVIDNYRPHRMHAKLVADEPILALTLMTISSRHMKLQGSGATSRGYQIHEVLWSNLRGMINRLFWGQEQFGGGFSSGGVVKTHESKTGHITWQGSLRTLGTIEALLLLTDWHPRALHFAPVDNETRLLDNEGVYDSANDRSGPEKNPVAFSDWLEPAWRSDRMSWMLLGTAVALSFEVGVFDNNHYTCKEFHGPGSECARKQRVRRMVLVYMSQTSGRLGLKPTLSFPEWRTDQVYEMTARKQRQGPQEAVDVMQECWMGIAGLMFQANEEIFPSKQFTSDLTSNGDYAMMIEKFQPMLTSWKVHFEAVKHRFEPIMQHLLSMEYEYARLFINSLGFQKVVESWVNINNEATTAGTSLGSSSHAGSGGVPFSLLLEFLKPNKKYIDEVSDAARNMLKTVMEGLVPDGHLVYASVRSYFRILPALIFTLKRFGFGASETDVRESFALLDGITKHLKECVVDDVHLSSRMAEGVRGLASSLRKRFIRIQAPNGGSTENSRAPTPSRGGPNPTSSEQIGTNNQQQQHVASQPRIRAQSNTNTYNNHNSASSPYGPARGGHGGYDPLAGIQRQTLADVTNVPFMPPTNISEYLNAGASPANDLPYPANTPAAAAEPLQNQQPVGDWFALPITNFFQNAQAPVHQGFGGMGPTVGSRDMLEMFTNEGYDGVDGGNQGQAWNGNGGGNGGNWGQGGGQGGYHNQ